MVQLITPTKSAVAPVSSAAAWHRLRFGFALKSSNIKTGPIPVTSSGRQSCPATCPFMGSGCYGENFRLGAYWQRLTAGDVGISWRQLLVKVAQLPPLTLWRHDQVGDLPPLRLAWGRVLLDELVAANLGRRGFTYTHHRLNEAGRIAVRQATAQGFTVNVSTETETAADAALAHGMRAVLTVADAVKWRWHTRGGNVAIVCPAQRFENITCASCQLCHSRPSNVVIAFLAHGTGAKKIRAALSRIAANG